jgi:hypothetical protein
MAISYEIRGFSANCAVRYWHLAEPGGSFHEGLPPYFSQGVEHRRRKGVDPAAAHPLTPRIARPIEDDAFCASSSFFAIAVASRINLGVRDQA